MSKKCTLLRQEAHFEVNMLKTPHVRTTFKSWDVAKLEGIYAVVARSTFRSHNVKSTTWWTTCTMYGPLLKVEMFKSVRCCGTKHMSKSKCAKHARFGTLLEVDMSKKCTLLWCETDFEVKSVNWRVRTKFGRSDLVLPGRRKGLCTLSKWANCEGFVAIPNTMAGVGHVKRICKDAFSVAGAVQETSSSELLGGLGADFLRGVAFWSIRSSGLLKWFCVTSEPLRMTWHHFSWQAQHFRQMEWKKIVKRIGTRPSALHVFEGSLTELLRFWVCQVQKLRKSRRIAAFSSFGLQIDR